MEIIIKPESFITSDPEYRNIQTNKEIVINIDPQEESIESACRRVIDESHTISFETYYEYSSNEMPFEKRLPYLLKDGEYIWNVSYSEANVADFKKTHGIKEKAPIIVMVDNYGGAGDVLSQLMQWVSGMPLSEYVVAGSIGCGINELAQFIKWLINKYETVDKIPGYFDFIGLLEKSQEWDVDILCATTGFEKNRVKTILLSLGFEYNGKTYVMRKNKNNEFHLYWDRNLEPIFGDEYVHRCAGVLCGVMVVWLWRKSRGEAGAKLKTR